jgi:IS1 family transposase
MNRLSNEDRCRVLACLVEGNSIRSTVRITGICKRTVSRLLVEFGESCERFADRVMTSLPCKAIQCDEIWSFVGCKAKNVHAESPEGWGDVWTWIAIDPETKLIPAWLIGDRTAQSAYRFMRNLERRLTERVQLSTDGHHAYLVAVKAAFLARTIDYGMLVKIYGDGSGEGKYSPNALTGIRRESILGLPVLANICTSHAERNNLTVRMSMRRFTRLTNGFSKSIENHRLACAIHFLHYNFCRMHQTLRCTPAMAAKLTDHVWELAELISLLEIDERRLAA